MKKLNLLLLLLCSLLALTSLDINAQSAPDVCTKYSATQIRELYKEHKKARSHDIAAPKNLTGKFVKDFPEARDIDWEKSTVLYEVEFEIGWIHSTDYKAYYDLDGNLLSYEQEISAKQLPAVVKNTALTKYPNFRIDDADQIIVAKDTLYKISLEKRHTDVKILCKHDGTVVYEYFD